VTSTVMTRRQAIVNACQWGIRNRTKISYGQIRPIPVNLAPFSLPFTTDCSGFVTLMAKWSGNPDPNGNGFDGQGYTGIMLTHLKHIPLRKTWRGDLAVFGAYPGLHVVTLLQGGSQDADPAVASHGSGVGPGRYSLSQVASFFGSRVLVTYLQLRPNTG
jgi:hypothetical protein